MDVFGLAERLRDPAPQIRVETLRILAMVEETRALAAIWWIFKHDPEPGVRAVAGWAGHLIWLAQQRGHSTQRAVEEVFSQSISPDRQELFLAALEADFPQSDDPTVQQYITEQ